MLNRDQDRERAAPLLALRGKSTHRNGANSHVPSRLVSRASPSPSLLVFFLKAVILDWILFSYAGASSAPFYSYRNFRKNLSSGLPIKLNEKPGWKHKKKREEKKVKGGKKSSACSYWNLFNFLSFFSAFFVLLFGLEKDKTSLSSSSFFFLSSTNFGYDQCPTSWIGVRKLPKKRQGSEGDKLPFAREIFLEIW